MDAFIANDQYTAITAVTFASAENYADGDGTAQSVSATIKVAAPYRSGTLEAEASAVSGADDLIQASDLNNGAIVEYSGSHAVWTYYTIKFNLTETTLEKVHDALIARDGEGNPVNNGFMSAAYKFTLTVNGATVTTPVRLLLLASLSESSYPYESFYPTNFTYPKYREIAAGNSLTFGNGVLTTSYASPRQNGDLIFTLPSDITTEVTVESEGGVPTTLITATGKFKSFNYAPPAIGDPVIFVSEPTEEILQLDTTVAGTKLSMDIPDCAGVAHALNVSTADTENFAVGVSAKAVTALTPDPDLSMIINKTGTRNTLVGKRCLNSDFVQFMGGTSSTSVIVGPSMIWPNRYQIQRTVHTTAAPKLSVTCKSSLVAKYTRSDGYSRFISGEENTTGYTYTASIVSSGEAIPHNYTTNLYDHKTTSRSGEPACMGSQDMTIEFSKGQFCPTTTYDPTYGYNYTYSAAKIFVLSGGDDTRYDISHIDNKHSTNTVSVEYTADRDPTSGDLISNTSKEETYYKYIKNSGIAATYDEALIFNPDMEPPIGGSGYVVCTVVLGQPAENRYKAAYSLSKLPAAAYLDLHPSIGAWSYTKTEEGESTMSDKEPVIETVSVSAHAPTRFDNIAPNYFYVNTDADNITSTWNIDSVATPEASSLSVNWSGVVAQIDETFNYILNCTEGHTLPDDVVQRDRHITRKCSSTTYKNISPALSIEESVTQYPDGSCEGTRKSTEYKRGGSFGSKDIFILETEQYIDHQADYYYRKETGELTVSRVRHLAVPAGSAAPKYSEVAAAAGAVSPVIVMDKVIVDTITAYESLEKPSPGTKTIVPAAFDVYRYTKEGSGQYTYEYKYDKVEQKVVIDTGPGDDTSSGCVIFIEPDEDLASPATFEENKSIDCWSDPVLVYQATNGGVSREESPTMDDIPACRTYEKLHELAESHKTTYGKELSSAYSLVNQANYHTEVKKNLDDALGAEGSSDKFSFIQIIGPRISYKINLMPVVGTYIGLDISYSGLSTVPNDGGGSGQGNITPQTPASE